MAYLSQKVLEAFEVSAIAHKDQIRKNKIPTPYFSHPAAVAMVVRSCGGSEAAVIAAVLHDVVEDTSYTAKDVEKKFGKKVLKLVMDVTEDKTLPWGDRNKKYNEHLKKASREALMISAADLLANRMSMLEEFSRGRNPWTDFSKNPEEYMRKRLALDQERITIIKKRLRGSLVQELEQIEKKVISLTKKIVW